MFLSMFLLLILRLEKMCIPYAGVKNSQIIIIQTGHLIPARRPDLVIINKKDNLQNSGLGWPLSKIERKWKEG